MRTESPHRHPERRLPVIGGVAGIRRPGLSSERHPARHRTPQLTFRQTVTGRAVPGGFGRLGACDGDHRGSWAKRWLHSSLLGGGSTIVVIISSRIACSPGHYPSGRRLQQPQHMSIGPPQLFSRARGRWSIARGGGRTHLSPRGRSPPRVIPAAITPTLLDFVV